MKKIGFQILFLLTLFYTGELLAQSKPAECVIFQKPQMLDGWQGRIGIKESRIFGIKLTDTTYNLTGTKDIISKNRNSYEPCAKANFVDTSKYRFRVFQAGVDGDAGYDPTLARRSGPCLPRLPVAPAGFTHSIRLGNTCGQHEGEGLFFTMYITPENALLYVHYAMVLQYLRDNDHGDEQSPEFIVRVRNQAGALVHPCTEMRTSSYKASERPGWNICGPLNNSGDTIPSAYTDWRKVAINLGSYIGDSITIEVLTGDCSFDAHYGYAYVVGECSPLKLSTQAGCDSTSFDLVTNITAPDGMDSYEWYVGDPDDPNTWDLIDDPARRNLRILPVFRSDMNGQVSKTFICKLTSYMNEKIPCTAPIWIKVNDLRPIVDIDRLILCDNNIKLINKSTTPEFSGLIPELLDTTATKWELGDGTIITNQHDSVSHQYASTGIKTISLSVQTLGSKCKGRKTVIVKLNDYVKPFFTSNKSVYCLRDTAVLTGIGATEYTWVFGNDTLRGTTIKRVLTFTDTSFHLIGKIGDCYGDTVCKIDILPYPKINFNGDPNICLGDLTNIRSSSTNGTNYFWSKSPTGDPIFEPGQLLRVKLEESTVFYASATNPNGCKSLDSILIRVLSPILSADTLRICPGAAITFMGTSTEPGNLQHFQWRSIPEDWTLSPTGAHQEKLVVRPTQTTDYYLTAVGTNNCYSKEAAQRIWVYPYPIPKIEFRPNFIDIEEPIVLFTDASEYGVTSLWDLGDGKQSTDRSLTHQYGSATLQKKFVEVKLTSFNELFCSDTVTLILPVRVFSVNAPNAFTPDAEDNKIFYLQTKGNIEDFRLSIYNRWGDLIFTSTDPIKGWDGTVKNQKAPIGTYIWTVSFRRAENNRTYTEKGSVTLIR